MDSYLIEKHFRQDLQDNQDVLVCHFPEENDKPNAPVAHTSNLSSIYQN